MTETVLDHMNIPHERAAKAEQLAYNSVFAFREYFGRPPNEKEQGMICSAIMRWMIGDDAPTSRVQ